MILESPHQISSEDLEALLQSGFVMGGRAGELFLGWGEAVSSALPNPAGPSVYAPDFHLESHKPWWSFKNFKLVMRQDLLLALNGTSFGAVPRDWQEPDKGHFHQVFTEIQNSINGSEIDKAVPVVFATSAGGLSLEERRAALMHVLKQDESLFPYGIWGADDGVLGITPELLFDYDEQKKVISTMALAGTKPAGDSSSLQKDHKESAEHEFVIDDLRMVLTPMGGVQVGATYEFQAGSLVHLRTDINVSVTKTGLEFSDLVGQLHPTPALGLFPREKNWSRLKDWEDSHPRNRYGAPFGVRFLDGSGQCLVAIRNLQWNKDATFLGSGCGIVKGSQFEKEWEELYSKRQSVLRSMCPQH